MVGPWLHGSSEDKQTFISNIRRLTEQPSRQVNKRVDGTQDLLDKVEELYGRSEGWKKLELPKRYQKLEVEKGWEKNLKMTPERYRKFEVAIGDGWSGREQHWKTIKKPRSELVWDADIKWLDPDEAGNTCRIGYRIEEVQFNKSGFVFNIVQEVVPDPTVVNVHRRFEGELKGADLFMVRCQSVGGRHRVLSSIYPPTYYEHRNDKPYDLFRLQYKGKKQHIVIPYLSPEHTVTEVGMSFNLEHAPWDNFPIPSYCGRNMGEFRKQEWTILSLQALYRLRENEREYVDKENTYRSLMRDAFNSFELQCKRDKREFPNIADVINRILKRDRAKLRLPLLRYDLHEQSLKTESEKEKAIKQIAWRQMQVRCPDALPHTRVQKKMNLRIHGIDEPVITLIFDRYVTEQVESDLKPVSDNPEESGNYDDDKFSNSVLDVASPDEGDVFFSVCDINFDLKDTKEEPMLRWEYFLHLEYMGYLHTEFATIEDLILDNGKWKKAKMSRWEAENRYAHINMVMRNYQKTGYPCQRVLKRKGPKSTGANTRETPAELIERVKSYLTPVLSTRENRFIACPIPKELLFLEQFH